MSSHKKKVFHGMDCLYVVFWPTTFFQSKSCRTSVSAILCSEINPLPSLAVFFFSFRVIRENAKRDLGLKGMRTLTNIIICFTLGSHLLYVDSILVLNTARWLLKPISQCTSYGLSSVAFCTSLRIGTRVFVRRFASKPSS